MSIYIDLSEDKELYARLKYLCARYGLNYRTFLGSLLLNHYNEVENLLSGKLKAKKEQEEKEEEWEELEIPDKETKKEEEMEELTLEEIEE